MRASRPGHPPTLGAVRSSSLDPADPADPTDPVAPTDPADPVAPDTGERPTYEQARNELMEVVRKLETGGTTLEDALALWERGETLATICQDWLDGARSRLDTALDPPGSA